MGPAALIFIIAYLTGEIKALILYLRVLQILSETLPELTAGISLPIKFQEREFPDFCHSLVNGIRFIRNSPGINESISLPMNQFFVTRG